MIIDYSKEEYQEMPNFKGGLNSIFGKMCFDGSVRILRAFIPVGSSIGYHQHEENAEIMYILSGSGTLTEDGVSHRVSSGQSTYCAKGHFHGLVNDGEEDLHFFAVVPELR